MSQNDHTERAYEAVEEAAAELEAAVASELALQQAEEPVAGLEAAKAGALPTTVKFVTSAHARDTLRRHSESAIGVLESRRDARIDQLRLSYNGQLSALQQDLERIEEQRSQALRIAEECAANARLTTQMINDLVKKCDEDIASETANFNRLIGAQRDVMNTIDQMVKGEG